MHDDSTQAALVSCSSRRPHHGGQHHRDHLQGLVTQLKPVVSTAEDKQAKGTDKSNKQKLRGLQDLPNELLFKIKNLLDDLPDHAAYWALCHQTASLYCDDEFRNLCLRANIGRPTLLNDRSWASTARMVSKHLHECTLCHRYMHDATLSMDQSAKQVYDKAGDAPWIAVISNLRQSAGRYSINWTKKEIQDRPELILTSLANTSSSSPHHEDAHSSSPSQQEEQYDVKLVQHPAMACRLAFIQPIRRVKCGFESDSVWQFGKAGQTASTSASGSSYHELNSRAAQAEEYRSNCFNVDGITVLDLLLAASDTPDIPTDGITSQPLTFGGILDDTLRGQSTIWVHATAQPEDLPNHHHLPQHPGQQPILDSGSLITPSTYAYATSTTTARSGGGRIEDTSSSLIHSPSSSSLDWGRIAELSYGLFEPMMMGSSGNSSLSSGYGYYQPPYTLKEVK